MVAPFPICAVCPTDRLTESLTLTEGRAHTQDTCTVQAQSGENRAPSMIREWERRRIKASGDSNRDCTRQDSFSLLLFLPLTASQCPYTMLCNVRAIYTTHTGSFRYQSNNRTLVESPWLLLLLLLPLASLLLLITIFIFKSKLFSYIANAWCTPPYAMETEEEE